MSFKKAIIDVGLTYCFASGVLASLIASLWLFWQILVIIGADFGLFDAPIEPSSTIVNGIVGYLIIMIASMSTWLIFKILLIITEKFDEK